MATPEETEMMKTQITQLLEQNEALQASIKTIQQHQNLEKTDSHHGELDEHKPNRCQKRFETHSYQMVSNPHRCPLSMAKEIR